MRGSMVFTEPLVSRKTFLSKPLRANRQSFSAISHLHPHLCSYTVTLLQSLDRTI